MLPGRVLMVLLKKYLVIILRALSAFFVALVKAFCASKKAEQHKRTKHELKMAVTRLEVENDINQKSDADVRADLSRWLRDK
ncbi:hypothetical protein A6B38_02410 [Bartonella bacilliformis]|nr:hypothetical protein AL467_02195 [Bartonella bacilliformis]EKS45016.1 hypothetical protein BbINS_02089 [Bartonella bacilliformis INS]KZM37875.1 hypothetical protein AWH67_02585 [Bartonella bacilliformis]KZN21925.1 hypothetical protein A6B38_02410 [Bartonella bacilliformis]QFZ90188.1 hypothetical protein GHC17_01980 [Bartonella bacilliformis]